MQDGPMGAAGSGGVRRSTELKEMDRKGLAIAIAVLLVLGVSSSASATKISKFDSGSKNSSYELKHKDLNVSWKNFDGDVDHEGKGQKVKDLIKKNLSKKTLSKGNEKGTKGSEREDYSNPAPEPSSALVFGLGLLVASRFARRSR
jgi:hypothetical protein